jgi:hypothetical protein
MGFDTCRIDASRFGGIETRPANIALLPCIKTGNSSAISSIVATPTVFGAVLGCTTATQAAIGCCALLSNTTGCLNSAFGVNALACTTTGCYNTAVGSNAGCCITTGGNNVAIGNCVQVASPTGSGQLAIGFGIANNWLTGNSTRAIKPGAGIIDCANSCGAAGQVLVSTGGNSVCWGSVAGNSPATPILQGTLFGSSDNSGESNTAVGFQALRCNVNGCGNVALGQQALGAANGACRSVAIGSFALANLNTTLVGAYNTAIGWRAGQTQTAGGRNVIIGSNLQLPNNTAS